MGDAFQIEYNKVMSMKCLIIEDADFMREIYRYALQNNPDLEIVGEASDGEQGLQLISSLKPDFILLDLVLPLKSGLDILKELSLVSAQTKALVITSIEDEQILSKAKALGAVICLKKPFTKSDLLRAVQTMSQKYSEVQGG